MDVVLASASPRRRRLLDEAGLAFVVEAADVDESVAPPASGEGHDPEAVALELAERKARAVAARHPGEALAVLGADTVVAVGVGRAVALLGKPADEAAARASLARLAGSRHRVVTGVCVVDAASGRLERAAATTHVTMRPLADEELDAYVRSGEWRDKAGGYAIQESADAFVTALEGAFDNVVGLPVPLALELLARAGVDAPPPGR